MNKFALALVGLLLTHGLAPSQAEDVHLAEQLRQEVSGLAWGQTSTDWHKQMPRAAWGTYNEFGTRGSEGEYVYRASLPMGYAFFYALPSQGEPVTRLERFTWESKPLARDAAQQLFQVLDTTFTQKFGAAEAKGSRWFDSRAWRTAQAQIKLSMNKIGTNRPVVLALSASTNELVKLEDTLSQEQIAYLRPVPDVTQELAAAVRPLAPDAAALLTQNWPQKQTHGLKVVATIQRLQALAKTQPEAQKPVLLLTGELLCRKLAAGMHRHAPDSYANPSELAEHMRAIGLPLDYSEPGAAWSSGQQLLERVQKDYANTRWGEWAFLDRLAQGWSLHCDGMTSPAVIEHGQAYLRQYPHSRYATTIRFLVAEAHESLWAFSKQKEGAYFNPAEYVASAPEHRRQALALFGQVLASKPEKRVKDYIEWHLPRLKLDIDTTARHFTCVDD